MVRHTAFRCCLRDILVSELVLGVSCFDLLGFLDFFSYCGFYELLAVVVQSGIVLYYLVYFLDHRHWDAYALSVVFSINGSRHLSSDPSGRSCS